MLSFHMKLTCITVNDYRQTFILRAHINLNYRYRIVSPEALISITQKDLWECRQIISHYRLFFSLISRLTSIADTEIGLKQNNSVISLAISVLTQKILCFRDDLSSHVIVLGDKAHEIPASSNYNAVGIHAQNVGELASVNLGCKLYEAITRVHYGEALKF